MKTIAGASALTAILVSLAAPVHAADLPAIKTDARNKVPACATPGRMMAFLSQRNASLDHRFAPIATEYMRHGEQLALRWDYAFFQMIVETGSLSFKRGNGVFGDVKPHQNNFAGLGATGKGEPGEKFPDISTGVKAHLQHVLIYAGERVEDAVADRTRKVQEWGILDKWRAGLKGPVTFRDLTRRWSPNDRAYAASIGSVADRFYDDYCNKPDPKPELVAEARGTRTAAKKSPPPAAVEIAASPMPPAPPQAEPRVSGADLARKAIERAKAEGEAVRSGLGASALAKAAKEAGPTQPDMTKATVTPAYTLLNPLNEEPQKAPDTAGQATVQTVSAPSGAVHAPVKAGKCRVWTASYGGEKAVVIRSQADQYVNYTVLDVNAGAEKRETDAYIAAYAKGGRTVGEFPNQAQALDKAFDLCPES